MQEKKESHKFALFFQELTKSTKTIQNKDVVHRISRVLRLRKNDEFILFNTQMHAQVRIQEVNKDSIDIHMVSYAANELYKPTITFLLPLLKKDAFEQAVYNLASCGVTVIQPVITKQSHQTTISSHDWERLHKILLEAAQVSKNYAMARLEQPVSFDQAIQGCNSGGIFFDPMGEKIDVMKLNKSQNLTLLIGPEGDLTEQEKALVKEKGFQFCRLTPTILKADQAALLAAGMIRSMA